MIICFRSINLQYILPSPSSGDQEGGGDQAGAAVHQGGGKEVRFEHLRVSLAFSRVKLALLGWWGVDGQLSREWGRCYYYPLDLASLVAARFSIVG